MKKSLFFILIISLILNLTACKDEQAVKMKEYYVNTAGEGWEIKDLTIQVFENNKIDFINGKLKIHDEIELAIEIYQNINDNWNTIWNESYSTVKGVIISKFFNNINLEEEIVDFNSPIFVQITINSVDNQEEVINFEALLNEETEN